MKLNKSAKNLNYVIGLGKSGFWAAKFLNSKNKRVIVIESNNNKDLYARKKKLEDILEMLKNLRKKYKTIGNFYLIKNFSKNLEVFLSNERSSK